MRSGNSAIKRRVWIGLAAALAVTGIWWTMARVKPAVVVASGPKPAPFVRLAGVGAGQDDQVLREQAELMDPTPLFFPTEWNFGQRPLRDNMRRQPGQVFSNFPEQLTLGEQKIKIYGDNPAIVPEHLSDVFVQGNEAPFAGMGQIDVPQTALAARSSFLEVRNLATQEDVIQKALVGISIPRTDFAPLEFLAVVSSSGLIGDLVLVSGSGWEEVDGFFRAYLVKTFRLGERLYPGRYRVLVGP